MINLFIYVIYLFISHVIFICFLLFLIIIGLVLLFISILDVFILWLRLVSGYFHLFAIIYDGVELFMLCIGLFVFLVEIFIVHFGRLIFWNLVLSHWVLCFIIRVRVIFILWSRNLLLFLAIGSCFLEFVSLVLLLFFKVFSEDD